MDLLEKRIRRFRVSMLSPIFLAAIVVWPVVLHGEQMIKYRGDGTDLQQIIEMAAEHAVVDCDKSSTFTFRQPLVIRKPLTLQGLHARLPEKLGRTALIEVEAEGVTLRDLELHGNFDSVSQDERSPLIRIARGKFFVERCRFYDGSKDGLMITPEPNRGDVIGGVVRDISAYRMGRDAVSISGGNRGAKVRNVIVQKVRLEKGYYRGAVEVSDGTENIVVKDVHARQCLYAVDVQDHKGASAANLDIVLDKIVAIDCAHIVRTANSPRDHAGLTLRKLVARRCKQPLKISHTRGVAIEGVRIEQHAIDAPVPIQLRNCHDVSITGIEMAGSDYDGKLYRCDKCTDVTFAAATSRPPKVISQPLGEITESRSE